MTEALRIVVIDDSDDIRDLLRMALKRDERFELVAEAPDGQTGLDTISEHRPDVVLLDLAMPAMDGIEVLDQLRERDVDPVVIVLSGFGSGPPEASAMEHGAAGYIEKGLSLREMSDRIIEVYARTRA